MTDWVKDGVISHPNGGYVSVDRTTDAVVCYDASGRRHRLDGPAVERADGTREWWANGQRHRLDGPANLLADGSREWWLHGVRLTEAEHAEIVARMIETGEAPDA